MHGVAQVVLDLERNPTAVVATDVGKPECGHGDGQEQAKPGPQPRGALENDPVDDLSLDEGDQRLAGTAERRPGEGQGHSPTMDEHLAPQPADPTYRDRGHERLVIDH